MAAKLKAASVTHDLIVMPGVDHNFLGPTQGPTREGNLKALAAAVQYVDRLVGSGSR